MREAIKRQHSTHRILRFRLPRPLMPRLAVRLDTRALPEELEDLADRWGHLLGRSARPLETSRTVLPGAVAVSALLGFFRSGTQPAVGEDGHVYLWLDGEIWDRGAAAYAAVPGGESAPSDADLCLRLYLEHGDRFVEWLNGQFVIAIYDDRTRRLLVCNDRYAFRPCFWQAGDGTFTCATEIKLLIEANGGRAEADPGGVLELLAYGYQLAGTTFFRGIHALLPGSRLVFERGRATLERYWRYRYPAETSRAGEDDLAAELAGRLRIAATRQSGGPGRVGMALSGGLDSRIVIAALPEPSPLCCAYTMGYPDSLDLLGARGLAERYGVRHIHLEPAAGYLSSTGPVAVWRNEGCFSYHDATGLQFHERLRPELDIILTGHAGGILSGGTILPRTFLNPGGVDLNEYMFARVLVPGAPGLRRLIAERVREEQWDELRRRFRATVDELGDQRRHLGDAVVAWYMEQRQARFTNHSAQADRYDFEVRAPLLDNDVVDCFLSLPYSARFAQRLYKKALATQFAGAAQIPWSKTGRPVPGRPLEILTHYYVSGITRRLVKRIPALAKARADRVRTGKVVADEMRRDRAFRFEIMEPFVSGDLFPEDILVRSAVRRLIDEHWAETRNHSEMLACLATVALTYRQFLISGLDPIAASSVRHEAAIR